MERRRQEVDLLRRKHVRLRHGEQYEWVVLEAVDLDSGWDRAATDILFLLPQGYPETAPDNFYVSAGLRLSGGRVPGSVNTNNLDHDGQKWDMFSWHVDGAWQPAADVHDGSNLLDFYASIRKRLGEAN